MKSALIKKMKLIGITVGIPMLIGVLIYLLFRSKNLIFVQFVQELELSKNLVFFNLISSEIILPNIILYSLPDALWAFALINLVLIIWDYTITVNSAIWILISVLIILLSEFGQLFQILKGTFDINDLIIMLIASTLPFIIFFKQIKTAHYENK